MADISVISPDGGTTELNIKDATARTNMGNLADLTTTAKTNLVAAINEAAASGGGTWGSITGTLSDQTDLYDTINDIYGVMGENGAKNLLDEDCTSLSISGLTITVNSDGSINIDGTASANITFRVGDLLPRFCPNNFIVNGLPSNGSSSTFNFRIGTKTSASDGTGTYLASVDSVDGYELDLNTVPTYGIALAINIISGTQFNDMLFKPMIRLASDTDSTYQPPALTNMQLTETMEQIYVDNGVLGAKNLLKFPYIDSTKTANGVTFTVDNTTGCVTANNTPDSGTYPSFNLASASFLNSLITEYGAIKVTGCPLGGGNSTYMMITRSTSKGYLYEKGTGLILDTADLTDNLYIQIRDGYTASNLVFKPMITLATDLKSSYENHVPYAMTNRELTEAVKVNEASSDFTLATGVAFLNDDNHYEANVGNVKYITAKVKGMTANANTWVTVGTLSGKLKPCSTGKVLSGTCLKNSSSEILDCIIENNTLKIRRGSSAIASAELYNISFVYI